LIRPLLLRVPFIMTAAHGSYTATAADPGTRDVSCGDHRYFIERSWLGADVSVISIYDNDTDATGRPYCKSNPNAQTVAELSVSGDDIWCVELFYISMDRQPIAKTSRLLSVTLGRVFEYDYLWQAGDWVKTDARTIDCAIDKNPMRQKILDK
jgi:hypothetical protein